MYLKQYCCKYIQTTMYISENLDIDADNIHTPAAPNICCTDAEISGPMPSPGIMVTSFL